MSNENERSEAIAEAIRLAAQLSTAVSKAEELGAVIDIEIDTVKVGPKTLKQVMVYAARL